MRNPSTRVAGAALIAALAAPAFAQGDEIRPLQLLTRPQAAQPQEFQFVQLIAQEWEKLGLHVEVQVMPWEQMADVVWYDRDEWDMTAWQMVGRPERSDPDEIVYNLFHSSTAESGYNFVGYSNPAFDEVAEAQRVETDEEARKALIHQAQAILAEDQPNAMLAHPFNTFAFDKGIFDPASVVDQSGIGIRNTWTFLSLEPTGEQRDVILNSADNIQAINPLYISGATDSWITELVWDRLLRVGPDGLPQAWAAESYEWVDGTTIDVTLRQGMAWHDGEPVTAEDVVFSFEAAGGGEAPMYAPFTSNIASMEVTGDRTIRFTLAEESAAFLTSSLAKVNLIPRHVWEPILTELAASDDNAESHQEEAPIGSGPFRFASWSTNEEVVLEANPDHWAAPKVDRWILRIVPNTEAAMGMLRSGGINFLSDFNADPAILEEAAAEDGDLEVVKTTDIGFRYVAFNNRRPPMDDPAFRRALSTAINRDLIVGAAFRGNAVKSNSVVSPALGFWHNAETVEGMETGLEEAQAMLEEAGYTLDGGALRYPEGVSETLAE